jgi:putative DNA primase/helicase
MLLEPIISNDADPPNFSANGKTHDQWIGRTAPSQAALLYESISDEGNARCTQQRYAGRFLYTDALGWLCYTGTHWTPKGAEAAVQRAIVETLTQRIQAAIRSDAPEKHDKLIKFCAPNRQRVQGAMYLLQSLADTDLEAFDTDPDRLNCANGVIDLHTGILLPHDPAQRFTQCTRIAYRPEADAEPFLQWLCATVQGGQETVNWLQMAIGYSLTGHTREEVLFYLYGPPRSGKGTLTEMLLAMLGAPLVKEVNFSTFTAPRSGDSQNFDLAPLKPCRLVLASESNQYERFNEAKVKALTGGNEIYCAFKHRSHFNYRPQFKIWLSSNQPVNADPNDDAVWGRLRIIEFPHSYLGQEDKSLKAAMKSPPVLEGMLAWAVQGAVQWYRLGAGGLQELACSTRIKTEQRAELDTVQAWIEECCVLGEQYFTPNRALYPSYRLWCEVTGIEPKKQKGLTQSLERKGLRKHRTERERGMLGLKIVP